MGGVETPPEGRPLLSDDDDDDDDDADDDDGGDDDNDDEEMRMKLCWRVAPRQAISSSR